jgi:hypothetical protein
MFTEIIDYVQGKHSLCLLVNIVDVYRIQSWIVCEIMRRLLLHSVDNYSSAG